MMTARGLAAVLVAGAVAGPAQAYECTRTNLDSGPSLTWRVRQVRWVLDGRLSSRISDRAGTQAAIEASFQAWSDVPCSDFEFVLSETRTGASAGAPEGGPYENVVTFVPSGWLYDKEIIALTTASFDDRTGQILDADVELNDQHFTFTLPTQTCQKAPGHMDLQNTLTHEVGHVIGLDHPPLAEQFETATMYASAPPCETDKRSLEEDDMAGVCAIYPVGEENQPCFPPEGPQFTVIETDDGMGCATTAGGGGGAALVVLLAGAVARRSRRRG